MSLSPALPDAVDLARQACETAGLDSSGLRLIRHYSNAVVLVPHVGAVGAVARVALGRHDRAQVQRSLWVTRWLRERGFPTVIPLAGIGVQTPKPEVSVSFWEYLPQPEPPRRFDSADLACLLARLHELRVPRGELADWQPLASLARALRGEPGTVLSPSQHRWLTDRVAEVGDRLKNREWVLGEAVIHGDAWLGNVMSAPAGPVLGDWDQVAWGPREVDLIPSWHATRRYGRDPAWTERFAAAYGYDLGGSPVYEDLMAMRDLAQLPGPLHRAPDSEPHATALRQRLGDLMAGNTTSPWLAL